MREEERKKLLKRQKRFNELRAKSVKKYQDSQKNPKTVSQKSRTVKISTLKRKLDTVFSQYIRLRDSDEHGMCNCISCNKYQYWREVDAGHYVNRVKMSLRYYEKNVHAQCRSCNRFTEGNIAQYTLALIKKYSFELLEWLSSESRVIKKYTRFEYKTLIDHYTELVKEMKEIKKLRPDDKLDT